MLRINARRRKVDVPASEPGHYFHGHKKAQKAQRKSDFCAFCAFLWLKNLAADFRVQPGSTDAE